MPSPTGQRLLYPNRLALVRSSLSTVPRSDGFHKRAPSAEQARHLRLRDLGRLVVCCLTERLSPYQNGAHICCKQYRGLATRYEKRAQSYRGFWVLALTILWL